MQVVLLSLSMPGNIVDGVIDMRGGSEDVLVEDPEGGVLLSTRKISPVWANSCERCQGV